MIHDDLNINNKSINKSTYNSKNNNNSLSDTEAVRSSSKKNKSVARPVIPSLKSEILSEQSKKFIPCPPNPKSPIPFETELFKGYSLIVLRTDPVDPHYQSFFLGKRLFEVQMQGKFKRMPTGELYVGTEAIEKVELGIITRSLSKAILQFLGTMINGLQVSFGDSPTNPDQQFPHLVAPMFNSLDKIVVTPPGETPPPMGIPFVESNEFKIQRRKFRSLNECNIDLECTYSFSVNSSQISWINWNLSGIPMVRPLDLRTFAGNSPIRLVGYEVPKDVIENYKNCHPQRLINYVFNLQLTRIECDDPVEFEIDSSDAEYDDPEDNDEFNEVCATIARTTTDENIDSPRITNRSKGSIMNVLEDDDDEIDDDDDENDEEIDGVDGKNNNLDDKPNKQKRKKGVRGAVAGWFRRQITPSDNFPEDTSDSISYALPDFEAEISGDLRYCPACIEIGVKNHENKRRILYLLPYQESNESTTYVSRLRSYKEIMKVLPKISIPKLHKNKKFSNEEIQRREIIETYKNAINKQLNSQLYILLNSTNNYDNYFLNRSNDIIYHPGLSNHKNIDLTLERWEGNVAMARSNRHWIEKYLIINKNKILLLKHIDTKRNQSIILLNTILSINVINNSNTPFNQLLYQFFEIETITRIYYFIVLNDKILKKWIVIFQSLLGPQIVKYDTTNSKIDGTQDNNIDGNTDNSKNSEVNGVYIAKPIDWKLDKRRIFNYRKIYFTLNNIPKHYQQLSNTQLVENILKKVFYLSDLSDNRNILIDNNKWIEFNNEISLLQVINLSNENEINKLVILLNLYHIMILHGSIVLGPPMAWVNWQSYFNTVTYIVGGDIISIAELEHNILRAGMCKSSAIFSKTTVPQSTFPTLALKYRDFRLNFCINNGSVSMASCVPIYKAEIIDKQLDEMTSLMLSETIEIDVRRRIVILPKICSTYLQDFCNKSLKSNHNVTSIDCLRTLSSYLNRIDRQEVMRMLSDNNHMTIKYKRFVFNCRRFGYFQSVYSNVDNQTSS